MNFYAAFVQLLGIGSFFCLVFILTLIGFTAPGYVHAQRPIGTDVCSFVAHPKQFDIKYVGVRAQTIWTIHGSALLDDHCKREEVEF
jgi:hypothetical protein